MGSSIYTRTGDAGTTSLADGTRIPKDSLRVTAYGTVDEANSWIGIAAAHVEDRLLKETLTFLQHRFFNCSSNVATPPGASFAPTKIAESDVAFLEQAIDRFEERTGKIDRFIVPGGTKAASFLHVARTVTRRAERALVALAVEEPVDALVRKFLNRSSDFLFAAARFANAVQGESDLFWDANLAAPALDRTNEAEVD